MAHRITYRPSGIIPSSAIGDIDIDVDGDFVDVTLTARGHQTVILSERYYAYGYRVTLCDIASLIEDEMRNSGYTVHDYTISVSGGTATGDSVTFTVLYCDRFAANPDIPTFLKENFLTTLSMRRIASGSAISLFFYAEKGESVAYSVAHSFTKVDSNSLYRHEYTIDGGKTADSSGVVQLNISLNSIVADAASFATARLGDITLLSFTVRCGQRSISFFVDNSLNDRETFIFRNCFNVWDMTTLPVVTTAKTDVERSTAIINRGSRFYDQSATKTYEVEAGPLTSDEAEWIDQLFTSYSVLRIETDATNHYDPQVLVPILISDSTCEIQDGDEKLNKVKFTWRYADNRPMVRLSASPGIFTSPYNIVYS